MTTFNHSGLPSFTDYTRSEALEIGRLDQLRWLGERAADIFPELGMSFKRSAAYGYADVELHRIGRVAK